MRIERQHDLELTGFSRTGDQKSAGLQRANVPSPAGDSVTISHLGSAFGVDHIISSDKNRIDQLRTAIGQGHYSIDALAISRRLVQDVLARP